MRLRRVFVTIFTKSVILVTLLAGIWVPARGQAFAVNAQTSAATPAAPASQSEGSLFFPKDWVRGYVDFQVAPPHNEPDLGRCVNAGPTCGAFARYILDGYIELQPFSRTPLRHFFGYAQPRLFMGDNVPQISYTASAQPLALESIFGLGFELPRGFEIRLETHKVYSYGKYDHSQGPFDPGPGQPLGQYTTIGVRWSFGGYGRRTHSW